MREIEWYGRVQLRLTKVVTPCHLLQQITMCMPLVTDEVIMPETNPTLLGLTTTITASYLTGNAMAVDQVPGLIRAVYQSLASLRDTMPQPTGDDAVQPPLPGARQRQSVFADHLVCLECGRSVKILKRHLLSRHGLSAEAYRAKWGLPESYRMIAPDYAVRRSQLAKQSGFGRRHTRRTRSAG